MLADRESISDIESISERERISQAEMVLVGLGEEFDDSMLQDCPQYAEGREKLGAMGLGTLIPAWADFCGGIHTKGQEDRKAIWAQERPGAEQGRCIRAQEGPGAEQGRCITAQERLTMALENLRVLLEPKNYFVVSVSFNSIISRVPWREGHLVMPCGSAVKKQCAAGCDAVLEMATEEDRLKLRGVFEKLYAGQQAELSGLLGKCPVCGRDMVLNNIYAENYNEDGYLGQWQLYGKWLKGTVNRRLLVLELGVGMRFPTVIRWPFEKVAYFNNKAFFCRVNQKLYQLTEELSGKGAGISQNAIDWLCGL